MTDKEKLEATRTEIHRLVDVRGYDKEMANDLFAFMDSLPNEPISEELVEAAITAADEDMQGRQIMEESNENRQLYSRIFRRGFKTGANWRKQQMMAKAINTEASFTMSVPSICISLPLGVNVGDKVKVIVIKED